MTPDEPEPMTCPFDGGHAYITQELRGGHASSDSDSMAYFVRCNTCAGRGPWFKTQGNAVRMWNRRDGLLPALRSMRDKLVVIIQKQRHAEELRKMRLDRDGHDDLAYKTRVVAGALAWTEGLLRDKDDAALLELAGARQATSGIPAPGSGAVEPKCELAPASSLRRGVKGCARCGEDHEPMPLFEMKRPVDGTYTHWAMCPNGGGPILYDLDPELGWRVPPEPAERGGVIVRRTEIITHARREALLDAARDLRKWAIEIDSQWHNEAWVKAGTIRECADRLEAHAKEIG